MLLYYGTALLAFALWSKERGQSDQQVSLYPSTSTSPANSESTAWLYGAVAILLIILGVARQSGYFRWITEVGRAIAWEQGWYASRTLPQQQVIHLVYYGSVLLFLVLAWRNRHALLRHGPVLLGVIFLLGFVSVRAVSLHAVDVLLTYRRVAGLRLGTTLEVGSLIFIAIALLIPYLIPVRMQFFYHRPHERAAREPE